MAAFFADHDFTVLPGLAKGLYYPVYAVDGPHGQYDDYYQEQEGVCTRFLSFSRLRHPSSISVFRVVA